MEYKNPIMNGPDPQELHPLKDSPWICSAKSTKTRNNIIIGDYTYYADYQEKQTFENQVLYNMPLLGDKLIIGKFCTIGQGTKFIMNGANHKLSGFANFPFFMFKGGWEKRDS